MFVYIYTHMKYIITIIALLFCISGFAQDIITTTSGDDITCKVKKITKNNVKYYLFGNGDTTLKSMHKTEVFTIKYESGLKEVFNEIKVNDNNEEGKWDESYYARQGREDAKDNYHSPGGAGFGTFATAFLGGPIIGLIPAIPISSTPPKDSHMNYPDRKLEENTAYKTAYRHQAHKTKAGHIWGCYAAGVILDVFAVVVVLLLM